MSEQTPENANPDRHHLRIRQQNTNKSLISQLDMLNSLRKDDYDICTIQEPYLDHNAKTRANNYWISIYPTTHNTAPEATRSIILINTHILTNNWRQIPIEHPDVTAIELTGTYGKLRLFNIYNDCNNNDAIKHVATFMRANPPPHSLITPTHHIWLGDFNRHHPLWDEPRNEHLFTRRNLDLAQPLIDMIGSFNMKMALPPGIPTLRAHSTGNHTRVDNVFCSEDLLDTVIKCQTDDATRPVKTDHYPITTYLDLFTHKSKPQPRLNFREVDWPEFSKTLKANLDNIPRPAVISNVNSFNRKLADLNTAIWNAINEHVSTTKPCPYSKRWWSAELTQSKKDTAKLGQQAKYFRDYPYHPVHEEYRQQRNKYANMIKNAKADHWTDWLEGLDESSVWKAAKLISSPPTDAAKSRIPTLQVKDPATKRVVREATSNKEKGDLLYDTYFPIADPDLTPPMEDFRYPPPRWSFTNLTNAQIHRAIDKMKPHKATRRGTIPNSVFIYAKDILVPYLGPIFRATHNLKVYPPEWALTETLILKKPAKPDYTSPSAWRPIVLSDGMARLLNACQAENMVNMCEKYHILPDNHFGARPGRTTTDSIHLLTKTVKDAWRKRHVASALFLDVKGAFPSVDIKRLIHNMRKRGIPKEYTDWLERRLKNRRTTIVFDDYRTDPFDVDNGLDQGDPFSGILYLLYNSDLPKITDVKKGERLLLFVDDAVVIATAKDFSGTHEKLRDVMDKPNGIFDWATIHNCEFGVDKFQLLDFTRKTLPHPFNTRKRIPYPRKALKLKNRSIPSKDTARFLGVVLDNKLTWKEQGAAALAKGQDWIIRFQRIARTTKGVHAKYFRQLYLSIAVPRMLYAADIFLTPHRHVGMRNKNGKPTQAIVKKLATIQRKAALLITGALRSAPTDAVEVLANLIPFRLLVDKCRHNAALRLATLPETHPLHKPVRNAAARLVKRYPTPMHDLMHRFNIKPGSTEKVQAVRHQANWKSDISTSIPTNGERAMEVIDRDDPDLKIFTDGSGMDDNIGASAVVYRNNREKASLRFKLGAIKHHTVFEGEATGLLLASNLILKERNVKSVMIYVDNQALIHAITKMRPTPSHYLLDAFHRAMTLIKKEHPGIKVSIKWVPAHKGVVGNERADLLAKKAITDSSSSENRLPSLLTKPLPASKSATKQAFQKKLQKETQEEWVKSSRFRRMERTDPRAPSTSYVKLISPLPRRAASLITQIRTGHIPVAKYLHRIGKVPSPTCPACKQETETIQHFILQCPAHERARQALRYEVGSRDINITRLTTKKKPIKALIKFIAETGRWNRAQRAPAEHEENSQE
jgi:ribonuclease HI/endonuclease/exonuclease/phosphatase family metal-dependent hydrolase